MKYLFAFVSDSGYNAININNWSACGQETFDVKKQNKKQNKTKQKNAKIRKLSRSPTTHVPYTCTNLDFGILL